MDAVKVCRKFSPPTGPSSPLQKNPATGISPSIFARSPASWSGSANSRDPRPVQVNSRAPAAGRPPRAAASPPSGGRTTPPAAPAAESGGFPLQGAPEILIGRAGVPDVELHRLAHLHLLAHGDGA